MDVFIEVLFEYDYVAYSITYDENFLYVFNMKTEDEVIRRLSDDKILIIDLPLFIWKLIADQFEKSGRFDDGEIDWGEDIEFDTMEEFF